MLLPTAKKLLWPKSDMKTTASNLAARKRLKRRQYNRGNKNLTPIKAGNAIFMKLPRELKWSLGPTIGSLGRGANEVEVDGRRLHKNCRQLQSTLEPSPEPSSHTEVSLVCQSENESKPPVVPESLTDQSQTKLTPEFEGNDATSGASTICPGQGRAHPSFPAQPLPGLKITCMTY